MSEVHMKDNILFEISNNDQEELKKLQDILSNTGIDVDIITKNVDNETIFFLSFDYDTNIIRVKKKRNAGRPHKGHKGRYTVGEIKEMQ